MFVSPGPRSQLLEDRRGRFFDESSTRFSTGPHCWASPSRPSSPTSAMRAADAANAGTPAAGPTNGATT